MQFAVLATKKRGYSSARWPDYHKRDYKKQAVDWYGYGPVKRVPKGCINAPAPVGVPAVAEVTLAAVPVVFLASLAIEITCQPVKLLKNTYQTSKLLKNPISLQSY